MKCFAFSKGDDYDIAEIQWRNLKIFFSRTTEPFSTNLDTKYLWVTGIQVCSNEEPLNSFQIDNGFFFLLINVMIESYVFIDLSCFIKWAMWPMGLLLFFLEETPFISITENTDECKYIIIIIIIIINNFKIKIVNK